MENKFKGKALNLIVVVEEVFNENKTASGLDLSGIVDANEKQKKGRVVSVGTECPKLSDGKYTIQEGNIVIFDKFKMTNFTQDGIAYIMVDYRDLLLIE
jgi:co-chaperonin GroES (HSP10)